MIIKTLLYHFQAPANVVKRFERSIKDPNRRKFAGMLTKLDESVGKVVEALQEQQMLENTIIVFTTDNGGPAGGFDLNHASNWPLRGVSKLTYLNANFQNWQAHSMVII